MELIVALGIGVLTACGVWLILRPRTFQVIMGLVLLTYGVNLFIFSMGRLVADRPPILDGVSTDAAQYADPVPQALVLTAIVITLGLTAFLLSVAYRAWQLNGHDEVQDDLEDRRIARIAAANQAIFADLDTPDLTSDLDLDAVEARDETQEARIP